jgi:TMEM175 potassium channel family protein
MNENRERKIGFAGKDPSRLIALSDGLFATVMTLLVLDLRIPDALSTDGGNPAAFIKWIGPHFFSYLLTFLVTGTYWLAHHRDFDHVIDHDRNLLGYNLLFLLFVGLLPFSTATVSLVNTKTSAFPTYWAIYAANIILAGIMLTLTWNYAVSHRMVSPETTAQQIRNINLRQMAIPAVFLISSVAEYLSPQSFPGPPTLLVIPLVWWLIDRFSPRDEPTRQPSHPGWTERLWRAGTLLIWLLIISLAAWSMSL